MNKRKMERYRDRLSAMRERLTANTAGLMGEALRRSGGEPSGKLSNAPQHLADLGTDNFEQEISISLLENEDQHLQAIGAALERIRRGTFGRCEECGGEIAEGRLDALPHARHCIDCARELQDGEVRYEQPGRL
jgi:DnaK suppressor protein